jgi:uncharacterized membrane protein
MTALVWMRIAHFAGFALWIAGLVALAIVLRAGARAKAPGILADIGATLVLISGIYTAVTRDLFSQPYLHIKLTLVAGLIGTHVALRVRAKKGKAGGAAGLLAAVITLSVIIIGVIVIRPMAR